MSLLAAEPLSAYRRVIAGCLVTAVVTGVVCAVGAYFDPVQFFRAYLSAYLLFLGVALGSMVILMIYHLTGGVWGFLSRRILEAAMRTLPLLAVLFLPIAFGVHYLYLWAQPEAIAGDEHLQAKQFYLNPPFFWLRAGIYFALWSALALMLSRWSRAEDVRADRRIAAKCLQLSGFGLVIYGISVHFMAIDWVMSLEPLFRSSIFGPLLAAGQVLAAQAFTLVVLALMASRPPIALAISEKALNDQGNLLLTFLIVWAYVVWFQFMLIWIANLPHEAIWYLSRSGPWEWVAYSIFVLHFAVPFFLLLLRSVKRSAALLGRVAGLILSMQLVFDYYLVCPAFSHTRIAEHWMDFLTPLAIGGVWLACFVWLLEQRPILPLHDMNQKHAVRLRRLDEEEAKQEELIFHA